MTYGTNNDIRNSQDLDPVEYAPIRGSTMREIKFNTETSPLYNRGDMVLIWVNEADLIQMKEAGNEW